MFIIGLSKISVKLLSLYFGYYKNSVGLMHFDFPCISGPASRTNNVLVYSVLFVLAFRVLFLCSAVWD